MFSQIRRSTGRVPRVMKRKFGLGPFSECSVMTGVGPGKEFWIVTRNSVSRQRLLAQCRDTVLYDATWSTSYRWLLGHDKVRCHDTIWPWWGRISVATWDFRVATELATTGEDSTHGRHPTIATACMTGKTGSSVLTYLSNNQKK